MVGVKLQTDWLELIIVKFGMWRGFVILVCTLICFKVAIIKNLKGGKDKIKTIRV